MGIWKFWATFFENLRTNTPQETKINKHKNKTKKNQQKNLNIFVINNNYNSRNKNLDIAKKGKN